jgi:hypothetical protein
LIVIKKKFFDFELIAGGRQLLVFSISSRFSSNMTRLPDKKCKKKSDVREIDKKKITILSYIALFISYMQLKDFFMQLIYFNMHVLLPGFLFHFFLHFLSGRRVILLLNLDEILNTNNCLPPAIS